MLRDEAGGHVSSLELRVARKTQQKVNVSVQSHDLRTEAAGQKVKTQNDELQAFLHVPDVFKLNATCRGFLFTKYCIYRNVV